MLVINGIYKAENGIFLHTNLKKQTLSMLILYFLVVTKLKKQLFIIANILGKLQYNCCLILWFM